MTHESCFQGVSESVVEVVLGGPGPEDALVDFECHPLERSFGMLLLVGSPNSAGEGSPSCIKSSSSSTCPTANRGPDTGLPFTPQASTGTTTTFRVCTLSCDHNRFAFCSTPCWQLYRIARPASVSFFRTLWMYTIASTSSSSPPLTG